MPKKKAATKKKVLKSKKSSTAESKSKSTRSAAIKKSPPLKKAKAKPKKETKTKSKAKKVSSRKPVSSPRFKGSSFPIVGIGASAGGLEAFKEFFSGISADSGLAFILVTHQHPTHTTVLPELLSKSTSMKIITAKNGMKVQPNTIYLNPAGKNLAIFNNTLLESEWKNPHSLNLPIDFFFRSLADDQKDKAIGVILSGTGTDGTLGIRAIKGESGMAMVQSPDSSKFPGMPDSAISTNLIDYILPPKDMPLQLVKYTDGQFKKDNKVVFDEVLPKIFMQLRSVSGNDFSKYKTSTVHRRIERRMNVHHLKDPREYLNYMKSNPIESSSLIKELLIGVTCFFRDKAAFESLQKHMKEYLNKKENGDPVRIWVPGCSSGEEAYSLAILLHEIMTKLDKNLQIQIFATDLDEQSIAVARAGAYPHGIAADIDPDRLKKYFKKEDSTYRIRKDIREMVIFAPQNLILDPPFTRLDAVSCRNLLIYLEASLQRIILSLFHYSLVANGILFLGSSESLGSDARNFNVLDRKWKIFSQKGNKVRLAAPAQFGEQVSLIDGPLPFKAGDRLKSTTTQDQVNKLLLDEYAPAGAIVNESGEVFFYHGKTGKFLEHSSGRPTNNILQLAREGLKIELAGAMRKMQGHEDQVRVNNVSVKVNGGFMIIDVILKKIKSPRSIENLILIGFVETDSHIKKAIVKTDKRKSKKGGDGRLQEVKEELQHTRETLQSTIEELETSNEELKSTNEELQSTNEELQSSNEEIETSKEEMQSLNEELQTTNAELQSKVEDLSQANDDMKNLLNSTEIATIFLDNDLNIKRYTEQSKTIINLIPSDVGRPLSDIVSRLKYDNLVKDGKEVLKTLAFKEIEVETREKIWYQMRILPYRTADNVIDGLVITLVDITKMKKTEAELERIKKKK